MPATVLLTRPAGRNDALAIRLREAGLDVCEAPALAIHLLPTLRPQPVAGNLYLFVSRQAVDAYFSDVSGPWPAGAWAGAVGAATACALHAHVPIAQILVPAKGDAPDSESLLALIDTRALPAAQVHILRAQRGRDWMADQLQARGWQVTCHALYDRSPVLMDESACKVLADTPDCVLLVTSPEAMEAIGTSLKHYGLAWPARLRVVTLHARMARRLQCWYAGRPADALHIVLSAPGDAALFHAILTASRQLH